MKSLFSLSIAIVLVLSSSCVSKKKYEELQDSKSSLRSELVRIQDMNTDLKKTKDDYIDLRSKHQKLSDECNDLRVRFRNIEQAHADLQKEYADLVDKNKSLLQISSEEKTQLSEKLAMKEKELSEKEKNLNELQKNLKERERKIDELQSQLAAQDQQLNSIFDKISNALLGYSDDELTVTRKDGKIYVSLSQNLLFEKGSDKIDQKGKEAIITLADVLEKNKDFDIEVEGHTDSDGSIERNWELSTQRATSVVKLLQKEGVQPERLIASGRALYLPVAPNNSPENKAKNRRTEIILSPDLSGLFDMIETSQK